MPHFDIQPSQIDVQSDETASIALLSSVDDTFVTSFLDALGSKLTDKIKTLYILLCTSGGSVSHGIALYYLLRGMRYKIIMHNIGNVDSIGNVVFMAGTERYAVPHGTFLMHRVRTDLEKQQMDYADIQEKVDNIQHDERRIKAILMAHTQISEKEMEQFFNVGQVKDTEYALDKGIIHEVRELSLPDIRSLITVMGQKDSSDQKHRYS